MSAIEWLSNHAKTASTALLRLLLVLGLVGGLGLVLAGGGWVVNSGWLAHVAPPLPTATPLKIRLHGASIVVRGVPNVFIAETSGKTGDATWTVTPPTGGKISPLDHRSAEFSTLEAGNVTLSVMVGGQNFQVASAQIDVEVVDFTDRPDPDRPVTPPVMPPQPQPQPNTPPAPAPIPTVQEYAAGALANVQSPDRGAEARIVAGTIKSIIGRLQTGMLPPETDVVVEIESQATKALGTKAAAWHNFFVSMNIAIDILRQQGMVTTAASTIGALSDIAAVLNKAS